MENEKKWIGKIIWAVICVSLILICITESLKQTCNEPHCFQRVVRYRDYCEEHLPKPVNSTPSNSKESSKTTGTTAASKPVSPKRGTTQKKSDSQSSSSVSKYDTWDVYDYDNPDDYASDFAEDYAYDEFGTVNEYYYEYGYEEAYDDWMDERE